MNRHLRRYRRHVRRANASRARVEATVQGRMAVVATLDRLADVADAAGDADAVSSLDRCIAELCCARRSDPPRLALQVTRFEDTQRAVFALGPDGQREILDWLLRLELGRPGCRS